MKSLVSASFRAGSTLADNNTAFLNIAGGILFNSTESLSELPVRHAGSFSFLFIRGIGNTNTVNGTTFTLRKSGADTAVTVSFLALQSGVMEDLTNEVSFANTDEVCIKGVAPNDVSGSRLFTLALTGVTFSPDAAGDAVSWMSVEGNSKTISAASTTEYFMPGGFNGTQATESFQAMRCMADFTASNLFVVCSSNLRTTDTVFRSRKNGANGAQSVTFGSLTGGTMEYVGAGDSLAVGDDYNYSWTTGTGTQNFVLVSISSLLHSSEGKFQMLWGAGTGTTFNSNSNQFQAINSARGSAISGSESTVQVYPRFDFTASGLMVNIETNTFTTLATVTRVRDDSANGNLNVSIAATLIGVFTDTLNTDIISIQDEVDFQTVCPNQAGNIQYGMIGLIGQEIVTPSDTPPMRMLMGVGT